MDDYLGELVIIIVKQSFELACSYFHDNMT